MPRSSTGSRKIAVHESAQTLILPEHHLRTPLTEDIERLCDPRRPTPDALFLNVAAKYFFAYLYEGSHDAVVSLPDLAEAFRCFARHQSLNEPNDDVELMNRMRRWSFALRMPADLPRAAQALRCVALRRLPEKALARPYVGLDIGTGAGLLLIGALAQARRNGFAAVEIRGLEYDSAVVERTSRLARDLGLGSVSLADGRDPRAYAVVAGKDLTFVAHEAISAVHQARRREQFLHVFQTLFATCGGRLQDTAFFPEGLIVYNQDMNVSILLSRLNGFRGSLEYQTADFAPQALYIEGKVVPLHRLGEEFLCYLADRPRLPGAGLNPGRR